MVYTFRLGFWFCFISFWTADNSDIARSLSYCVVPGVILFRPIWCFTLAFILYYLASASPRFGNWELVTWLVVYFMFWLRMFLSVRSFSRNRRQTAMFDCGIFGTSLLMFYWICVGGIIKKCSISYSTCEFYFPDKCFKISKYQSMRFVFPYAYV